MTSNFITVFSSVRRLSNSQFSIIYSLVFTISPKWLLPCSSTAICDASPFQCKVCRLHLKCDGTRAENRFRLLKKRTSPFKSAGASVQSTTGSRGARISGINAGYTMLRGSVKGTGYPLHSPVFPSLPLPCVTVCHRFSTGLYPGYPPDGLMSVTASVF